VPFVAKATGLPIAKIAARVMAGEKLKSFDLNTSLRHHVAVKEAVFPFARFPGVDIILGPEMKSTGEVMGLDSNFAARLPEERRWAPAWSPARQRHGLRLGQGQGQAQHCRRHQALARYGF
jgi:carbamoyl-phosphate synthase large subunit